MAIQFLYQIDITKDSFQEGWEKFWLGRQEDVDVEIKDFCLRLAEGTIKNLNVIDAEIIQHAENWKLERMACVDRNILRLGCFEIIYCEDIPPKVTINEAVELAKYYSGSEAGKFVNGVLDKIMLKRKK